MIKNIISDLRIARRITQEQLAEMLKVTRQTIISLEKNKYIPSLEMGFKVSRVFEMKIEEIFNYSE